MPAYPLFSLLEPWNAKQQASFLDGLSLARFADAAPIFEKDDHSTDVYFLIRGSVKSININAKGNISYFRLRQPGDCFGYYSAVSSEPRTATMIAVGEVVAARITAKKFMQLVTEDAGIARNFIKLLMRLLRTETKRLTNLTALPAHERIAAELVGMEGNVVTIAERAEFASYLGMTRETLSRNLGRLVRQKLIAVVGDEIHILDRDGLGLLTEA